MENLSENVVAAWDAERDALNRRYARRRTAGVMIDPAAFLAHLQQRVLPLLSQIEVLHAERLRPTLNALYDASLDLFAAGLLGPEAKLPWVDRAWERLLPKTVSLLAREPLRVAGCLSNAMVQVARQANARPAAWLAQMAWLSPRCCSVDELLQLGQVCAWQAGFVPYRNVALQLLADMRPELAQEVLKLRSAEQVPAALAKFAANRWFSMTSAAISPDAVLPMAAVGGFVGFGGPFLRPPVLLQADEMLLVTDGVTQWQLFADAYGAWFQRIGSAPAKISPLKKHREITIDKRGTLLWNQRQLISSEIPSGPAIPPLAGLQSLAIYGETLALSFPTSHLIFLFTTAGAYA